MVYVQSNTNMASFDTFIQANAELKTLMDSAKPTRKCVREQKKRIREHMEQEGLVEYEVGEYKFSLKEEDKFRFSKNAFVEWLQQLPGEQPDDMITLLENFEEDTTEKCKVFTCKRRKTEE